MINKVSVHFHKAKGNTTIYEILYFNGKCIKFASNIKINHYKKTFSSNSTVRLNINLVLHVS